MCTFMLLLISHVQPFLNTPFNLELTTIGYGGKRPKVSNVMISLPPSYINFFEFRSVVESTAAQSACLESTI